jgi:hypothetical protein
MPKLGRGRDCPRMVPGVRVRNASSFTIFWCTKEFALELAKVKKRLLLYQIDFQQ